MSTDQQTNKKILTTKVANIPKTLEFDPGSGRTLAACLKHASRTEFVFCTKRFEKKMFSAENKFSGGRVSNT